MENHIKELPISFKRKGVTYTQVENTKDYYIYRCNPDKMKSEYYECFKKKPIEEFTYKDGKFVHLGTLKYKYPSDEEFGHWAWCCMTLKQAKNKIYQVFYNSL